MHVTTWLMHTSGKTTDRQKPFHRNLFVFWLEALKTSFFGDIAAQSLLLLATVDKRLCSGRVEVCDATAGL